MLRIFILLGCLSACAPLPLIDGTGEKKDNFVVNSDDAAASLIGKLHDPMGDVMVVAHRGCWRNAPENSIAALKNCLSLGVDIIEVDLRLSKDGEVIVIHDKTFKRMAGVEAAVNALTLDEIKRLRLKDGAGRHAPFTDQQVPTFREFVIAADRRILFNLDIKSDFEKIARKAAVILRELKACHLTMFALVSIPDEVNALSGPLLGCASYIANLRLPMGKMSNAARSYKKFNPVAVAARFDEWSYLAEGADDVAAMDTRLWVNTLRVWHAGGKIDADALVDPDALWGRLLNYGVNMIQTDEPEALIRYLEQVKEGTVQFNR